MVTFTAVPAAHGLAQFICRPVVRGHDMRQLMKACLLAFADIRPVVRADLHPALTRVSVTDPPATYNGYRVRVGRERGPEPLRPLDGMNVSRAMTITYRLIVTFKHCAS